MDEELIEKFTLELSKESDEDSDGELTEVQIPKNNKNKADWYDTNKFKTILTTIDSNNFNHKNKIGKSKLNDINSLINNIKNKTISEVDAKKKLNALNKIKKTEIKNECLINGPKKLLNLVDDLLEAIFNNNKNKNENNNVNVKEYDNVSVNENDNDNISDNANDNDNVDDNDSDNDNVDDYEIMKINNYFKTIDETKSFQDQTEELKKEEYLDECWYMCYYDNNKEINFKIFKLKCAYLLIDIDENLFKEIFGSTFVALADKLINTTSKEQYQIIISNIKKIKIKFTNKMILIIL